MNKHSIIYRTALSLLLSLITLGSQAQQVNTMYFMDNIPYRNFLNPAFQPYSNFYIGLPVIGYTQFSVGNNSLTLKNLAYKKDGQLISFLHPDGNVDNLYKSLRQVTNFQANVHLNLLNFGFRTGKAYWNFSLTEKTETNIGMPKDFMKFALYGTPDINGNSYNFKDLGLDISNYIEAGLGYSRTINDQWSVGGKLKFLWGVANVSMVNKNFDLYAGIDKWKIKLNGVINASGPGTLTSPTEAMTIAERLDSVHYIRPDAQDFLKPAGLGGAIDLGTTYKPINRLTLSAAVVDLGFINWKNGVNNMNYTADYEFAGFGINNVNAKTDFKQKMDSLKNSLKGAVSTTHTKNTYSTYLNPKLNLGAEYGLSKNNEITIGLLSRTMLHNNNLFEELTASVNLKPIDWFNLSASYSVLNGRMSNIGLGMAVRAGFLHWFITTDYVPLRYAQLSNPISLGGLSFTPSVPYNTKGINLATGFSFEFGYHKDADKDGVVDRKDKCPETPFGVLVTKDGCPVDSDGDGVPDYLDKCPNTPEAAYGKIDPNGCPTDSDGDGVPDYKDKCPNTPTAAIGHVDSLGCELDTDKDGVFDYLDKCPNTPTGVQVDSIGCPLDADKDGVPDYLDKCPNTPIEAKGTVDENGCPKDSDGDGVFDYLDLCPNTPIEARGFVDKNGCPKDTDGDGIPDYLDKCPDTPLEARGTVDEHGCPRDTDGDGVLDYLDNCPKVPGSVTNKGCPEIKKEVKKLFQKALQGIQFETGKYTIKSSSFKILDQIATVLIANPTYLVQVQGHTDNVGKSDANMILSDNRAKAVKDYLINKGVSADRLTSKGYGDTMPVASNKTKTGRTLNRRVEFIVTFEETVTE